MPKKQNSSEQTGKTREYRVGKGKPPTEFQFKPGNKAALGKGRPRNFTQLRALVQEIGAEELQGAGLTRIAAKVRALYASKNAGDNVTLLSYGWGRVPLPIQIDKMSDVELKDFVTQQLRELGGSLGGGEAAQSSPDVAVGGGAESQPDSSI